MAQGGHSLKNHWYFVLKDLEDELIKNKDVIKGRVLDFGCGNKPYEELFDTSEYIGLEYDCEISRAGNKADVFYNGKTFPFEDNSFDSVISTQVLEHVPNPQECLNEMARVLKSGGAMIISIPFVHEEHGSPYDFYRFSVNGIKIMLDKAGLETIQIRKLTCGIKAVVSIFLFYMSRIHVKLIKFAFILNFFGKILSEIYKSDENLYMNIFIVALKK